MLCTPTFQLNMILQYYYKSIDRDGLKAIGRNNVAQSSEVSSNS